MRLVGKLGLFGTALVALSCARAGTPRPATPPPAEVEGRPSRIPDSAPERAAALRSASGPHLQLEAEEERWGIEAAKERKRLEEQRKQTSPTPTPPATGSGSIGVPPPPNAPKPPAAPPRP